MFWKAKGGCVSIDDTDMDYISFGNGSDILIMLPGLGDGLTTVKRMAIAMAIAYRMYAKDYKVYVFSRKNHLKEGYSTRDMAKDQAKAMKILGITKAKVLGISQGGMIAQYLAIDYPDLIEKLVLAVTLSKQNKNIQEVVGNWITLAEQEKYKYLMIDISENSYSENYLKKYRFLYPLLGKIGKPKDFRRFLIQASSCIQHDAYMELNNIICPTLIIGGDNDKIVGVTSSVELTDKIKDSELFIYKGLGHAAYEEAKDFNNRVLNYLSK
ncbi:MULTISPECIES: alpha/beta fold hydrolase [unclassified Clostridioides]|uniref:alpha/beta fold hydrolase n=1 Tax=unclassified Clostridioides TaxID=2635829 RepID=UPI001D118021|nr:alpha/beta hydrolase [Clostridioides sp. ES-S-0001-02]MCC0703553.1 alpha/beta hydrolase [Clostridioides sp. ES-S-0049-02]